MIVTGFDRGFDLVRATMQYEAELHQSVTAGDAARIRRDLAIKLGADFPQQRAVEVELANIIAYFHDYTIAADKVNAALSDHGLRDMAKTLRKVTGEIADSVTYILDQAGIHNWRRAS